MAASPYVPITPMQGWVCPVCGGGNSPYAGRCPCVPVAAPVYPKITINGPTTTPFWSQPTMVTDFSTKIVSSTTENSLVLN